MAEFGDMVRLIDDAFDVGVYLPASDVDEYDDELNWLLVDTDAGIIKWVTDGQFVYYNTIPFVEEMTVLGHIEAAISLLRGDERYTKRDIAVGEKYVSLTDDGRIGGPFVNDGPGTLTSYSLGSAVRFPVVPPDHEVDKVAKAVSEMSAHEIAKILVENGVEL